MNNIISKLAESNGQKEIDFFKDTDVKYNDVINHLSNEDRNTQIEILDSISNYLSSSLESANNFFFILASGVKSLKGGEL